MIARPRTVVARPCCRTVAALAACLLLSQAAQAQLRTWNASTGSWLVATNWQPTSLPTSASDATVSNGGACLVPTGGVARVRSLTVVNAESTLAVSMNGSLSSSSAIITNDAVAGVSGEWQCANLLQIGAGGGIGSMNVGIGGRLTSRLASVGGDVNSTGIATVSGGTWNNTEGLTVGGLGNGTLTVRNAGAVSVQNGLGTLLLAHLAGSTGTLRIGDGAAPGAFTALAIEGGAGTAGVIFNHNSAGYGFSPSLTGTLGVTNSAGTTTLSGSNNYGGGTRVSAGRLGRGTPAAFPDHTPYEIHGILDLNGLGLIMSKLSGASSGVILIGDATLTVDQTADTVFDGTLSGGNGAFVKQGTGKLSVGGNSTFAGGTTVIGGTLIVQGGVPGPAVVNAGATIAGDGIINGSLHILPNGWVSGGSSVGQLNCNGSVSLEGTLHVDIHDGELYDKLVVGGAVALGSSANLTFTAPAITFSADDRLFIIENSDFSAPSGTFNGLPDGGSNGTPVPALANTGGFSEWRIYYHANAAADALNGGNDVAVAPVEVTYPLGDMNCDKLVSVGDIAGFVLALTNPAGYATQYPNCNINNADMNETGSITVSDIGFFVAALTGG